MPSVGPASTDRSATFPTRAAGSSIFAPAASAKIPNFAVDVGSRRQARTARLGRAGRYRAVDLEARPRAGPTRSRHPRRHHQDDAPGDERDGREPDVASFALHGDEADEPVLGRLVERGLHDELKGTAYAIIDGVDGRTHHLVFSDLEMTGDAKPGAIVETRAYDDAGSRKRLSLATRSDLTVEAQVAAPGATWIDRQLLAKESALSSGGFGAEVREAMDRRIDHLVEQDLARRQGQRVIFARDLINTLRRRELDEAAAKLSADTGLAHRPSAEGEHVSGVYRQRVTLASGRFAMIDDGLGFQLVPWRPALGAEAGSARVRHIDPRRRGSTGASSASADSACSDIDPVIEAAPAATSQSRRFREILQCRFGNMTLPSEGFSHEGESHAGRPRGSARRSPGRAIQPCSPRDSCSTSWPSSRCSTSTSRPPTGAR